MKKVWRFCTIGMLMASLSILLMGVAQALTNSGGGSWQYYRTITINNNGNALTNYQVLVNLTESNFPVNARASGADIRFTDANGTELSYWIENWDYAGRSARVWINVTNIPANGITSMTMHYGNPKAVSSSNGTNTFDFFDDFEDGDYIQNPMWISKSAGTWQASNHYLHSGMNGKIVYDIYTIQNQALGVYEWDFRYNGGDEHFWVYFIANDISSYALMYNSNIKWDSIGFYNETGKLLWPQKLTNGQWYHLKVTKDSNGMIKYYINGDYKNSFIKDVLASSAKFRISTEGDADWDNIRVRKYASSEPSVIVGTEQIKGPASQKRIKFVQLTDVHIGPDPLLCGFGDSESLPCLLSFTTSLDRFKVVSDDIISQKPDFVLVTGDLVEWNSASQYNAFKALISKFKENNIPVYIVPGNHDRRGEDIPTWNYLLPNPIFPNNDLTNYKQYIGDGYNYDIRDNIFDRSGYRFIGLDSGSDLNPPKFPESTDPEQIKEYLTKLRHYVTYPNGSGLSKKQIDFINNYTIDGKTIIFMHHPAIDNCWDNTCNVIAENRDLFVKLAKDKHVKLVLTGHIHDSKFFDKNGQVSSTFNPYGTITGTSINTIIKTDFARSPLFVQTRSATKDVSGYLVVDVGDTSIFNEEMSLADIKLIGRTGTPETILYLNSPADLHVYDESGRHTGLNAAGEIENSIPDSYYFEEYRIGNTTLPAFTFLYNTTLNYSYEILSNFSRENITSDQATFIFTIKQKIQGAITTIKYNNVSINRNSIAYLRINKTETNYIMQIDMDNDSVIDSEKQPDSIETDYAPTATILSPADGSTWDQGQQVTFNGSGFDQEDGTLTKLIWISDRDEVIGNGNFSTANLSAGVHNITLLVNDSAGQVNTANITITVRDTVLPVLYIDYPAENKIFNKQNISISGVAYDDSGILNVTINGLQAGQENWNATLTLNEGWNVITVNATDNKGFSTIANRTAYYNSSLASDTQPPAVITNLTHKTGLDKSGRAWINWSWDNPEDQDFSYVMIYIDNIPMENTSGSYFSIDGLSKDADYNISILSADIVDNINYTEIKDTVKTPPPDTIPPVTTIAVSGIPGNNDWYVSSVQINLSADDYEPGTGVAGTEFSFDNINWSTYAAPFNINHEGITTVFYRSTDNAGNIESIRNQTIKIDKILPNISINGVVDGYYYNNDITPVITVTDANLNNQTVTLNGASFTSSSVVSAEGNYTLVASADDAAGNTIMKIVNFVIDKTPPDAAISFNVSSKDIEVYNNETGDAINYIVLSSKKESDNKKSDEEEESGWELRRYTLKDLANNLFELVLMHKKEGNEVKVKAINMQYNSSFVIDAPMNEIQVSYSTGKNSSIKELEQKIDIKKQLDCVAKYSLKENETEIKLKFEGQEEQKENRAGIAIFKLVTNKGGLNLTLKER